MWPEWRPGRVGTEGGRPSRRAEEEPVGEKQTRTGDGAPGTEKPGGTREEPGSVAAQKSPVSADRASDGEPTVVLKCMHVFRSAPRREGREIFAQDTQIQHPLAGGKAHTLSRRPLAAAGMGPRVDRRGPPEAPVPRSPSPPGPPPPARAGSCLQHRLRGAEPLGIRAP